MSDCGQEEFEDTKEVVRICKWKDRPHNGQKDKQRSTKHYTENLRSSNTNPTKNRGCTQLLWKGKQFLIYMCTRRVTLITNPVTSHE